MEDRKKEIEEFYRQILSDPKSKERIEDKAKEIANEEDLRQLICEEIMPLMKKFNVDFSAQELLEYEKEMLKELSDEDLANVSGGRGIAIKPLLGLGIMAFSMFAGMGLESFAARNGRKGTGGKPGTSQTGKGSSSENDDNDANNEEESKPTTKKTTSKKKRRFKRRNKAKKVNSTSTEAEENLNETNIDDDDNDNNETTISVTDDKNTSSTDNSSGDENQISMATNSNDNDYDDGAENNNIDEDNINQNSDGNNEEDSKPTTEKTTRKKKRRFKRRNKAKKVNSTSTETEEHLNETNVDDDDNDNNETTVSVTDDKNTAGSDNSSSDENQTSMATKKAMETANSNNNDNYDDGEKNDRIDLNNIDPVWIRIKIDDNETVYEYSKNHDKNYEPMTESNFFAFVNKFQESGLGYFPKNARYLSKALKCLVLNENPMEQLSAKLLEEINDTLEENQDALENLPKAEKDKVDKFLKEYEKYDNMDPNKIDIAISDNGLLFKYDGEPMPKSEFFTFSKIYQRNNVYNSGCNKRFELEQALKFILINENIVEDFKGKTYFGIDKCFELVSDLKHNNRDWDKLQPKSKSKLNTFLIRKATDDIRHKKKYANLPQSILFDNDENAYYSDDNGVFYPFLYKRNVKDITIHGEVFDENGNKFSVEKICLANRFGFNKDLEKVTIAEDAKNITICSLPEDFYGNRDNYARHMRKLKKIIFEGGQENITIESNTFRYMNTLEDIIFNTKSKYNKINIGEGAFASCINLGSLEFPENVDELILEKEAFFECSNMKSVTCPENCETFYVGEQAFALTKNLEKFNAPLICKKATIGHFAFKDLRDEWRYYMSDLNKVELNADELIIDENTGVSYIYKGKLHSIDTKDNDNKSNKEVASSESKSDDLNNNDEKDDIDDSKDTQEIKSDVINGNDDDDVDQNNNANNEEESKPKKTTSKKKRLVNRPTKTTKTIKKRAKKVNPTRRLKKSLNETNTDNDDDDNNEVNVDVIDD